MISETYFTCFHNKCKGEKRNSERKGRGGKEGRKERWKEGR